MNSDMRNWGCVGNGCPRADNCQRYLDQDSRQFMFRSAPFNHYNDGEKEEFRCGYQEYPPKD